jgi:hypothetical protein
MFSWLIQEVLGNLPSWLWPALAGGSFVINLLSGILSHLPQFKPWHAFIKPVSWIGILVGVFMYGGAGVTAIYQEELKDAQHKVELAEEKSNSANDLLAQKTQIKTKVIHDVQVVYKDRIKEVTKTIDADCKFDSEASKILNDAAVNPIKATK